MKGKIIRVCIFTLVIIIQFCLIACNNKIHKDDFVGRYRLDRVMGLDSEPGKMPNLVLNLEEKNNFSLSHSNGMIYGYWTLQAVDGKYLLVLSSSGVSERGEINGSQIKFTGTIKFLDSNISEAIFVKE